MPNFGAWTREVRTDKKMTQTECAARAGMKLQQWNQIEKQVKNPERSTVIAVARGLDEPEDSGLLAAGFIPNATPDDVPAEWRSLWLATPADRREKLMKATRGVQEAIATF